MRLPTSQLPFYPRMSAPLTSPSPLTKLEIAILSLSLVMDSPNNLLVLSAITTTAATIRPSSHSHFLCSVPSHHVALSLPTLRMVVARDQHSSFLIYSSLLLEKLPTIAVSG